MPDRLRTAALVAWLLLPACDAGPEEVAPPEPVAESSVPAVPGAREDAIGPFDTGQETVLSP